ncbi:MAG: CsgG/HfaB family protein [Alphaproteobacteria bacterium]
MRFGLKIVGLVGLGLVVAGCAPRAIYGDNGVQPQYSFPVTNNDTPYSACLRNLAALPGNNLPVIAVGEVSDKTGQINYEENGNALSQGAAEMMTSALFLSGKANLVERFDLRVPLAEVSMAEQGLLNRGIDSYRGQIPGSDFIILGALTELNYNITSDGAGLWIMGMGAGARTVVINVALDARVVNSRNFTVVYAKSLQKQVYGFEVEANVFRFFGNTLVEFDAGSVRNEPLQIAVRSVVEMFVYGMMTEAFGLPTTPECELVSLEYPYTLQTED